jgi:hypothetical protein
MKKIIFFVLLCSVVFFFGYNLKSEKGKNQQPEINENKTANLTPGWVQIPLFCPYPLKKVFFKDASTGCITCASFYFDDSLRTTTNGGQNWLLKGIPYPMWDPWTCFFTSDYEYNGTSLYRSAAKYTNPYQDAWSYISGNCGISWSVLREWHFLNHTIYFSNITCDKNIFFEYDIYDGMANLYVSSNSGINFFAYSDFPGTKVVSPSYSVLKPDVIYGLNGNIYKSTNTGVNFNLIKSGSYQRICAVDSSVIIAISGTSVSRSTNSGVSWSDIVFPVSLNSISFPDANTGYISGNSGNIYKTTNKGLNWINQNLPTTGSLIDCYFVSTSTGYAITNSALFKTTSGGITSANTSLEKISEFSLSQNFPNPFNPVTKIKYTIHNREFVSLKIFDMLGKEICTLVNENKNEGHYSVDFNAVSLSSGIYYYKLQAGTFSQLRKMVIVK